MSPAQLALPCVHRYVLPTPEPGYGGTLVGVCKFCGTAHEYHDPEYREKTSEWRDIERAGRRTR